MQTRILLHVGPYNLQESVVQHFRDACENMELVATTDSTSLDQLADTQFDVLVAEVVPFNLAKWPRLRFVQLLSAGFNHLSGHPLWDTDIAVANASGTHSVPIGQFVTCAVLMLAHRMPQLLAAGTTREWKREGLDGGVVRCSTAGIVGYGSVGRECARQLSALGMRIVCLKRNPAQRRDEGFSAWPGTGDLAGEIPELWFGPGHLGEMLPFCDTVVVTAPSTLETLGIIGVRELALMKPTATLINVARGGIVDERALADALRNGRFAGAVIDCFETEPIPRDHVFFDTPNMVLTPHMAGVSTSFWPAMAELVKENVGRFSAGRPILNRVNRSLGY